MTTITYSSLPPVSLDFLLDFNSPMLALGGPIGTGKTFVSAMRVLMKAMHIKPMPDGVRRSKFIIVRKRYGDLEQSVVPIFSRICGPAFAMTGKRSPMLGRIRMDDGHGPIECELWLYAFETVADVEKIRSLAFTDGMIVEAQELDAPSMIVDIFKRCGRFPSPANADDQEDHEDNPMLEYTFPGGTRAFGRQLAMDFNFTSRRHWFHHFLVENNPVRADGTQRISVYEQPPTHIWVPGAAVDGYRVKGVQTTFKGESGAFIRNDEALHYIKQQGWSYWESIIEQSFGDDAKIQQDILAQFGDSGTGKPVYPGFLREWHVADKSIAYIPGLPVWVGVDNGLNNAWIFCQQDGRGQLLVIHEVVNVGDDAKSISNAISEDIHPYINNHLPQHKVVMVLDQAFWSREGGEGRTQVELLSNAGFHVEKCPFKFTSPIREATTDIIRSRRVTISPTCNRLIDALAGGFHYPLIKSLGTFSEVPNQTSEHSHPANAFEFVCARLSNHSPIKRTGKKQKREFNFI